MPKPLDRYQLLDRYRHHLLIERYRQQRTWLEYRRTILDFLAFTGREPGEVRPKDLHAYLNRRKLSDATRHTYATHIKSFYRWAAAARLLPADPLASVHTPPQRLGPPRAIELPDVRRLMLSAYNDPRLYLVCWLMYGAGLRCCEVSSLRVEDCQLGQQPTIRVRGKGGKTRVVPLHEQVAYALRTALDGRGQVGPVVESQVDAGQPIGAKHVSRIVAEALHRLGIHATGHQLRHSFATQLLAATNGEGIHAISRLLGHASVGTTERYVSGFDADAIAAVQLLPDPRTADPRPLRAVP